MSYGSQTPYLNDYAAGVYTANVEIGTPPAPPGQSAWIDNLNDVIIDNLGDKIIFKDG